MDGLLQAHAFEQGHKRTAWIATTTYLGVNGLELEDIDQDEAADFVLDVVEHRLDVVGAALWLSDRLVF